MVRISRSLPDYQVVGGECYMVPELCKETLSRAGAGPQGGVRGSNPTV
jgi:hypothetical protein